MGLIIYSTIAILVFTQLAKHSTYGFFACLAASMAWPITGLASLVVVVIRGAYR